jgi:serine/threonine protein kinase
MDESNLKQNNTSRSQAQSILSSFALSLCNGSSFLGHNLTPDEESALKQIKILTNQDLEKKGESDSWYEILKFEDSFVLDEKTLGAELFLKFKTELNKTKSHTPITNCVKYLTKKAPNATKELLGKENTKLYRHGQKVGEDDLYYAIGEIKDTSGKQKREVLGRGAFGKAQKAVLLNTKKGTFTNVAVKSVKHFKISEEIARYRANLGNSLESDGAIKVLQIIDKESHNHSSKTLSIQELGTQDLQRWTKKGFDAEEIGLAFKMLKRFNTSHLHRDVKEANIIFMKDENGNNIAKLIDLDEAVKTGAEPKLTHIFGTALTMSPEAIKGQLNVKSDVFALGNLLFRYLHTQCNTDCQAPYYNQLRLNPDHSNNLITAYLMPGKVNIMQTQGEVYLNMGKKCAELSVPDTIKDKNVKILLAGLCKMLLVDPNTRPSMAELESDDPDFWNLVTNIEQLKATATLLKTELSRISTDQKEKQEKKEQITGKASETQTSELQRNDEDKELIPEDRLAQAYPRVHNVDRPPGKNVPEEEIL